MLRQAGETPAAAAFARARIKTSRFTIEIARAFADVLLNTADSARWFGVAPPDRAVAIELIELRAQFVERHGSVPGLVVWLGATPGRALLYEWRGGRKRCVRRLVFSSL